LIPNHVWSKTAAVNARWFDMKSKASGDEYRDYIFASQRSIETQGELTQFTASFAQSHRISIPFSVDPQGRLMAAAQSDNELGKRVGITRTPTIFVVTSNSKVPYLEVLDPQSQLYSTIDTALADTRSAAPAKAAHK
jgi:protein-disulfide isomerase